MDDKRNCNYTIALTLPMLRLISSKTQWFFENHLNPVMLEFIEKPSPSILRWASRYQGFSDFSCFLHYFVLAKLATSSIRVEGLASWFWRSAGDLHSITSHAAELHLIFRNPDKISQNLLPANQSYPLVNIALSVRQQWYNTGSRSRQSPR